MGSWSAQKGYIRLVAFGPLCDAAIILSFRVLVKLVGASI